MGRVCHIEIRFPPRGAYITLVAGLFVAPSLVMVNYRGMLLCLPLQVSYRRSSRVNYVVSGTSATTMARVSCCIICQAHPIGSLVSSNIGCIWEEYDTLDLITR